MKKRNNKKDNLNAILGLGGSAFVLLGLGLVIYRLREREKLYTAMRKMYNTQLIDNSGDEVNWTLPDGTKIDLIGNKGASHLGLKQIHRMAFFLGDKKARSERELAEERKKLYSSSVDEIDAFLKKSSSKIIPLIGIGSVKSTILRNQKRGMKVYPTILKSWSPKDAALKEKFLSKSLKHPGPVYKSSDFSSGKSHLQSTDWPNYVSKLEAGSTHPWLYSMYLMNPENYIDKDQNHIKEVLFSASDWDKDLST
jgi:hypothetical protein